MFGKIGNFYSETVQELKKVTWPNRDELWQSTLVVIITTFILAGFIFIADTFWAFIVRLILG